MGIIYKVNKGGTLVWTIPKQMKAAGYVLGVKLEAIAVNDGFLLKIALDQSKSKMIANPISVQETP